MQEIENQSRSHFWLFDSTGRELSNRPIPPRHDARERNFDEPPLPNEMPPDDRQMREDTRPPRQAENRELLERVRALTF